MKKTTSNLIPAFYRNLLILCVIVAAVAFVFFLLFMNYRFAVDLRGTNLKNMKVETEKRVASVGFFFADRKDDLINLALSREISVFFENKALGMSMEYGLKYSLLPIRERFQYLVNRKKLGSDAVYSRIMLIERNGTILVDTLTTTGHKVMREGLKELLVPKYRDGAILSIDGGREIVASLSYFFKNHYTGQIIAWIQPQTLYKNILGEGGSPSDISSLITNEGKTFQSVGVSFPSQISSLPNMAALTLGEPFEFQDLNGEKQSWIGVKTPISGTPFHMLRLITASNVVGKLTPQYLLTTMGVIAFVLLGGAAFTIILNVRAKETVRESEEKFRAFFETSRDCVFITSKDGRFIDFNDAAVWLLGYESRDELQQVRIPDLYQDEQDRHRHTQIIEQQGFCQDFPVNLRKKDGSIINTLVTSVLKKDKNGEVIGYQGTIKDVTDQKRAEEALRESERRLSEIIDFLPDATFAIDREGKVITWNRAIEEMTGVKTEYMLGKGNYEYSLPFYGTRRPILIDLVFETNEEIVKKYRFIEKKGDILFTEADVPLNNQNRVLSGKARPLYDNMGNVIGAIESIRDITERKQAEEEKRSLQERLQRAEKMEALGTLAGGVAHDLNNVLGVVVGYAELILNSVDESSPIRPRLVNIMKGGERAAAIVQDLLTLARRGVPSKNVLNLNSIISDFQQLPEFENLSSYHSSVRIKTDLEPDLLNISGSSVHLAKTLFNLVSNASESMTKGGVLTIKTANQYLDKPLQGYDEVRDGDYVVLSVSDTGEGIPAADLKRIFEPFYTKKVMGRSGTGLGLAVVWGTVKDHHGYINVQSEEGKGSTFTLYFPVTREDISSEAVAVAISEYMGHGESVLIVDDVKGQCDLAAEMLQTLNYNVTTVSSGEEAVAYLKEHQADLMVLDMIMDPGMDGLDTHRSVLEIHPKQKAIIVSGFSESDRVHAAQALGAGAYVRKPYVIEKLGLAVREELDRK
ncbi:MAG: PAS domain S-box protein [Deltaproteobacteria bacterium]|nr:PAS domain S-box protein [Deltaproteobacteria bacterium]